MTTNLNLNVMTQEQLAAKLAQIEADRAALIAQLEVVSKSDAIAAELIENIKVKLDELEGVALTSVVGKLAEFLQPYGVTVTTTVQEVNTPAKATRKRGQVESVDSIPGLVKLSDRFGATKDGDSSYTVYIGVDNRRATKTSSNTTNAWTEYLKEEYSVGSETLENAGSLITGSYLVKASGLGLRHVATLANLNFAVEPNSEENDINAKKEGKHLDQNLQLVSAKPEVNTDADDEIDTDELIQEEVMETEPVKVVPTHTEEAKPQLLQPEEYIGKTITTSAYGKEMMGVISGYYPERGDKCFSADLEGLPIDAWLPMGSFEVINDEAFMPKFTEQLKTERASEELDLAELPM